MPVSSLTIIFNYRGEKGNRSSKSNQRMRASLLFPPRIYLLFRKEPKVFLLKNQIETEGQQLGAMTEMYSNAFYNLGNVVLLRVFK